MAEFKQVAFLFYWIWMTFLEKMIMNYNNGLRILPGSKKYFFCNIYVFATWVKNLKLQKTDSILLSYQKTDTKMKPWVATY